MTETHVVGLIDFLTGAKYERAVTASLDTGLPDPSTFPIASPWSSNDLQRIVATDVFGPQLPVNTRSAAMRIGAVARGRNLLVSSIARQPLAALAVTGPLPPKPWMTRTHDGSSWQLRNAWTVDDLIFYGQSCWSRVNDPSTGQPASYSRINQGEWAINPDNRIEVRGIVQADDEITLIPGWHEGILGFGVDVLHDARSLYQIVRDRLGAPLPPLDLHQESGRPLTNDEIDELLDRWGSARKPGGSRSGVGFTNQHIKANVLQSDDGELMIEARNAAALDLARIIGVTAGLLDATAPKASLNYETQTGRNEEFVDRDLWLYTGPIAGRLSMDDVMPAGEHCAFDFGSFTTPAQPATGPTVED